MYTCANCHSFSLDGKTLGMDLDGPQNDKGMYTLVPIRRQMSISSKDVIEWSTSEGKLTGDIRVGFMSQVSPDGQYVATMIQGPGARQKGSLNNFYTANFKDYRFLQVFYPTRGILAWYSRAAGKLQPLPGADDQRYVHTNAVWTPDGKYLVFARAEARDAYPPGVKVAERANDPNETQIQYDLYRIPFNGGKGGQPERIRGASQNGMSNAFPKVSPDGRWIIFVACHNGELMRPDGQLYIVPAAGGEARRLRANTPLMNSWHSFSPNGRWLVFSSKSRGPYTKMFLTHLDTEGNSSPAVLIDDATAANRAVNIPEFVNIPPDGLLKIDVPAVEFYRRYNVAFELARKGQYEEAIAEWKKALEFDPGEASVYLNLGVALARMGKPDEAIAQYQKALAITPDAAEVHFRLGSALADTGKFDEAIAHFRKVLETRPANQSEHLRCDHLQSDGQGAGRERRDGRSTRRSGKGDAAPSGLWTASLRLRAGAGASEPIRRGSGIRRSRAAGRWGSGGSARIAGRASGQKTALGRGGPRVPAGAGIATRLRPGAFGSGNGSGRSGRHARCRATSSRGCQRQRWGNGPDGHARPSAARATVGARAIRATPKG